MRDVDQLVKFNEFAPVNEKFSSVPGLSDTVSEFQQDFSSWTALATSIHVKISIGQLNSITYFTSVLQEQHRSKWVEGAKRGEGGGGEETKSEL